MQASLHVWLLQVFQASSGSCCGCRRRAGPRGRSQPLAGTRLHPFAAAASRRVWAGARCSAAGSPLYMMLAASPAVCPGVACTLGSSAFALHQRLDSACDGGALSLACAFRTPPPGPWCNVLWWRATSGWWLRSRRRAARIRPAAGLRPAAEPGGGPARVRSRVRAGRRIRWLRSRLRRSSAAGAASGRRRRAGTGRGGEGRIASLTARLACLGWVRRRRWWRRRGCSQVRVGIMQHSAARALAQGVIVRCHQCISGLSGPRTVHPYPPARPLY
jgi:hypothetical protein